MTRAEPRIEATALALTGQEERTTLGDGEHRRSTGGAEEKKRGRRGGAEEEQRRSRGGAEEEQRRNSGGAEEERGEEEAVKGSVSTQV